MLTNKEIGNRIVQARKERGYTLEEVAKKIGVATSTVQRYEAGTINSIKLPVIEAISRVLNVNPAWIIGKVSTPHPALNEAAILSPKDERDIARDIEGIWKTLESQEALMFDGDPMTAEAKQSIIDAMKLGMAAAKLRNKEKYNPNKNKKG